MKTNLLVVARRILTIVGCIQLLTGCYSMNLDTKGSRDIYAGNCAKGVAELREGLKSRDVETAAGSNVLLANLYEEGECGFPQSEDTAKLYLIAAARLGFQPAIKRLVCMDPTKAAQCQAQSDADYAEVQAMIAAAPPPPQGDPLAAAHQMQAQAQAQILNSTQRAAANPSPGYTPPAPPAYSSPFAQNSASGHGYVYDNALNQCARLGNDNTNGSSTYFQNNCNVPFKIIWTQPGMAPGEILNCAPGARCTIGVFGIGFDQLNVQTKFAACPVDDYIETSPGNQWQGVGTFYCRKP